MCGILVPEGGGEAHSNFRVKVLPSVGNNMFKVTQLDSLHHNTLTVLCIKNKLKVSGCTYTIYHQYNNNEQLSNQFVLSC